MLPTDNPDQPISPSQPAASMGDDAETAPVVPAPAALVPAALAPIELAPVEVAPTSAPETEADAPADLLSTIHWEQIEADTQSTRARNKRFAAPLLALSILVVVGLVAGFLLWRNDSNSPSSKGRPAVIVPTTKPNNPAPAAVGSPGSNWQLAWADEFDGTELDQTKWTAENSTYGDANGEEQCYTPDNLVVADGLLQIVARRESTTCPDGTIEEFSSGLIRSKDKFSTAFGRFEMRAKLPAGQGLWPAFWLLSNNYPYGRQGRSGELDIMEMIGSEPQKIVGTAHWSYEKCGWACSRLGAEYVLPGTSTVDDFHTYGLEWTPGHIEWDVDGVTYYAMGEGEKHQWSAAAERAIDGSLPFPAPFDETNPMYMLVNLSVGGVLSGEVDETTPLPATYAIDYVRVYKTP